MSLPGIVVDNSAVVPAYFREDEHDRFDAGLVTNRPRSLIHAIRMRKVNTFVPPSFFREFLNVCTQPLFQPGRRDQSLVEEIRTQWEELLSLRLFVIRTQDICDLCGDLVFNEQCPSADAWYVAAAIHAKATLWMSHDHRDGLAAIAARFVEVNLLSKQSPAY